MAKRYIIESTKGTFTSNYLSAITNWQQETQGAYATLRDTLTGNSLTDISDLFAGEFEFDRHVVAASKVQELLESE